MIKTAAQEKFFDGELPDFVRLFSGSVFELKGEHWKFVDGIHTVYLNFNNFPSVMKPLIPNVKRIMIDFLEKNSPPVAVSMLNTLLRLADVIEKTSAMPVLEITEAHVLNYFAEYKDRDTMDYKLSAVLGRWSEMGLLGLSQNAAKLVKTLKKKPPKRGHAVLTLDPVQGPFTDFEVQQLTQAVNLAYAENRITSQFYFLTILAMLTGQRVSQYCAMKVCDLVLSQSECGAHSYEVFIPKAKQRGAVLREEFIRRPLLKEFGAAFYAYAQDVQAEYPKLGSQAPMFPSDAESGLQQLAPEFEGHWTSVTLAYYFRKLLGEIAPISPRTCEPMHMAVGRFRDTLGTRAAQEGFGELVIAEMLGHADTQSVKCYVAVIPEIAQRLDKQLARDLAPIANAFVGTILTSRSAATRFGDSSSEIIDYRNSGKGVGNCGTTYNCQFNAPVACYLCPKFEAWVDAPHAELYQELETERKRMLEIGGERMAAVNDLAMTAIRSVMDECARIKSGLEFAHG